jgi:KDO2-lipid IV(A) lauroyltransferase
LYGKLAAEMTLESASAPIPAWWVRAISRLPLSALHALSRLFAVLALKVFPYRPRVIDANLALAFPELDVSARERIKRDFYRGYGDVMVEIIKSATIDGAELDRRMELVGLETVRETLATGTPALLLAAHQCNWEWILLAISRHLGYPFDVAYKPLKNPWADREMFALRTRFGARLIPADKLTRDVIARRRVPRLIALVADQEPVDSDRRHWTRFLNRDSAFFMGGEVLVQRLGYPSFFCAIERTDRGCYRVRFEKLSEVGEVFGEGEFTERYARRVERQIHEAPPDWPWSHKRWRLPVPDVIANSRLIVNE